MEQNIGKPSFLGTGKNSQDQVSLSRVSSVVKHNLEGNQENGGKKKEDSNQLANFLDMSSFDKGSGEEEFGGRGSPSMLQSDMTGKTKDHNPFIEHYMNMTGGKPFRQTATHRDIFKLLIESEKVK